MVEIQPDLGFLLHLDPPELNKALRRGHWFDYRTLVLVFEKCVEWERMTTNGRERPMFVMFEAQRGVLCVCVCVFSTHRCRNQGRGGDQGHVPPKLFINCYINCSLLSNCVPPIQKFSYTYGTCMHIQMYVRYHLPTTSLHINTYLINLQILVTGPLLAILVSAFLIQLVAPQLAYTAS